MDKKHKQTDPTLLCRLLCVSADQFFLFYLFIFIFLIEQTQDDISWTNLQSDEVWPLTFLY